MVNIRWGGQEGFLKEETIFLFLATQVFLQSWYTGASLAVARGL